MASHGRSLLSEELRNLKVEKYTLPSPKPSTSAPPRPTNGTIATTNAQGALWHDMLIIKAWGAHAVLASTWFPGLSLHNMTT